MQKAIKLMGRNVFKQFQREFPQHCLQKVFFLICQLNVLCKGNNFLKSSLWCTPGKELINSIWGSI